MRGICAKREEEGEEQEQEQQEEGGECSINNNLERFEDQFILHHHHNNHHQHHHQMQQNMGGGDLHVNSRCFIFPTNSTQILPGWAFNQPPPYPTRDQDPFLHPQQPPPPPHQPLYGHASAAHGLMLTNRNTGSLRVGGGGGMMMNNINGGFGYEVVGGGSSAMDHLRIFSETLGQVVQAPGGSVSGSGSGGPFGLQAELAKMTAQEIMDAKALAASKSHSEAERRRRERINNHLAKLRSLLPNTTKTDKASLLAEVIQHVKELKRQTSLIAETSPVPTEVDELTVDNASDDDGKVVIRASLCCEDRSDLLPDLIKTLKALRLRTLKAEITTLGGRVKNVLFITGEEDSIGEEQMMNSITSIQEALKAVMEKTNGDDSSSGSVKRQRTNVNVLNEHRSI